MDKRNWKIIYSDFGGMEKKAAELISRELGQYILRDWGVYTIHVLTCEKENGFPTDCNAVVVGIYSESSVIRELVNESDIPKDGYVVKVIDNPKNPEFKLAIVTAIEKREVFYGAVDFVDDYFASAVPHNGSLRQTQDLFTKKMPDYYNASAPKIKTRSVFTWGHPINDYREYIENMARLRLNQLIIWNDYAPVNAKDIVDYAHSFGIKIIWGYAWGWSTNCAEISLDTLPELSRSVLDKYEREYADIGGDGIYFQSFTELHCDYIGDTLIAEAVTEFVNRTADMFLEKYPDLFIQFGLHAWSVEKHLDYIKNVDKRVEIMWEDCGAFPYDYEPLINDRAEFDKALKFADDILSLRKCGSAGMLYKGQMILDWSRFEHQSGPFVLGCSSETIKQHDLAMVEPNWRYYQSGWLKNGRYAYEMTRHIAENEETTVGMAGMFAGGIWFSEALCAQILWECDREYDEILDKVSKRRSVKMV